MTRGLWFDAQTAAMGCISGLGNGIKCACLQEAGGDSRQQCLCDSISGGNSHRQTFRRKLVLR